jgi:polo-like kinase 1
MSGKSPRVSGADDPDRAQIVEEKVVKVNGEVAMRRYNKGRFLGKGGFARCYEFTNLETRAISAAKVVSKASLTKSRQKQKLMSEIKIHRSLHHSGVVGFEHFFEDAENVYILLELCTNQTMSELLRRRKRLIELEVQCYVLQIVRTLQYLHLHRVIHRDLKLGNLFLSEKMEIKIGDFGLATKLEFDGERKRKICGTPNYIAPEVLEGKSGHSYEVDIWSLGVIIYTLLVGKPPFETADVKTTYRRIKMNAYSFPESVQLSDQSKSLITRVLVSDPTKRPTLEDILSHEFFHQGNPIPPLMPVSTLSVPPPSSFLRQYAAASHVPPAQLRLTETAPSSAQMSASRPATRITRVDMANTERIPRVSREVPKPADPDQPIRDTPRVQGKALPGSQELWVKKWVDYSSKYGLGYLLSNGATGVFFNDSTKIYLSPKGQRLYYMERKGTEKTDIIHTLSLTDYPKELQKKVTLLQHFRSYLEGDAKDETGVGEESETQITPIYVKKWMRTRHAIMFRLSNKIVQVNFQDHTEIILSSESKLVTYVNKRGERTTYPLSSALESTNLEMSKRLKYTKDILTHMLNTGGGGTGGRPGSPPFTDKPDQ